MLKTLVHTSQRTQCVPSILVQSALWKLATVYCEINSKYIVDCVGKCRVSYCYSRLCA